MKRSAIVLSASFLTLFVLLAAGPAFPQGRMRVAVLDLKSDGVPARTAHTVSDMIRTDLVNTGKLTVIERAQMDMILREQGFQQTGCTDQECAVQVGKILSTQKILIGSVSPLGTAIIINVRIVDVEKGTAEFAAREKADTEATLDGAVERLTQKLTRSMRVALDVKEPGRPFAEYIRGTSFELKPAYLVPVGDFADILKPGAGVMLGVYRRDVVFKNLDVGIDAGYWGFKGERFDVDSAYMIPLLAAARYSFRLPWNLTLAPELMTGVTYDSVETILYGGSKERKSEFQWFSMAGAALSYPVWKRFTVSAGADYGIVHEPDGPMGVVVVKLGVAYNL